MNNSIDATEQLHHLIIIIQSKLMRPIIQQRKTELSPLEVLCLITLEENQTVTMTMLANVLRVSKSQLTRLVDNLVSQGFAKRDFDNMDRRSIKISLTEAGLALLANIEKEAREDLAARLEAFDENSKRELSNAANSLTRLLKELP